MKQKSHILNSKGFSLLEFFISAIVLFVALSLSISAVNYISQTNEMSYEEIVALQDAHRAIEQVRQQSAIGLFPENVINTFPDNQAIAGFNNLPGEQVTINYVSTTENPLNLTISVTWNSTTKNGNNRTMTTQLTTLVTQR